METRCEYSKLTVPNDRTYTHVAGMYVREVARKVGFEQDERESIAKAVEEVLTAVIERAFEPHEQGTIEVSCERVPLGLKVSVKDRGAPFEPLPITECRIDGQPPADLRSGEPICLAKGYVDDVEFHNLGPEGKETVLIKYLTNRSITDYYEACDLEPYVLEEQPRAAGTEPIEIAIRPFQPADAVEVSRCVYRSYGYTYGYEHLYFPERVVQLNESGDVLSVVAETSEHQIAGHAAFIRPQPPSLTGEMGMAVVKPEFRSHGLLNRMTDYLLKEIRSESVIGVYGRAVTNHTFSQQVGMRMGMRDCALQLAFVPADVTFRGITEKLLHRDTAIVHFMYVHPPSRGQLCIPAHHRDMVLRLYENIGASWELEEHDGSRASCEQDDSSVRTGTYTRMAFAHIDVMRYGRDVIREVKARLREFCLNRFEVIHLYLNLHDPCTCVFTSAFEELGFFFSGILPGVFPGDALILQYLNNVDVDYDGLRIHAQGGKDLRDYVKKLDPNGPGR